MVTFSKENIMNVNKNNSDKLEDVKKDSKYIKYSNILNRKVFSKDVNWGDKV